MEAIEPRRVDRDEADAALRALARVDRNAAMDRVIRRYRDRLFHHAAYVLKDYQEAFDVTQEVFIRAMREPRFFEDDFKIKPWLFRVTSNLCFNNVRDRRRRGAILEAFPPPTESAADQVDRVFAEEQQAVILLAMERLTPDHREILALRYYSDLTYEEIAESLGIRLGTVMSRLSRAKGRLLEALPPPGVV